MADYHDDTHRPGGPAMAEFVIGDQNHVDVSI